MLRPPRRLRRWSWSLRYLAVLLWRFRVTLLLGGVLFGGAPLAFTALFRFPNGTRPGFGEAMHHVYFLLYGQPSLPYVDNWVIELLNLLLPPAGIALVVDGGVRFAFLFLARQRNDREWITVIARSLRGHVVVCGAGRVGYRVARELSDLGTDFVVVERSEQAAFVAILRDAGVPVLVDDIRSPGCLARLNLAHAKAIVCATDDDLTNLNAGLDARRINPAIRVVLRLFDDDLVSKMRDAFMAEAISSSALAGPAMALAALDPHVIHSFHVDGRRMVMSHLEASLTLVGLTVDEVRSRHGALVVAIRRGGKADLVHPAGGELIAVGDQLTLQAEWERYCRLREEMGV
jgi:Trk K+ transport system NAD-binding subunit